MVSEKKVYFQRPGADPAILKGRGRSTIGGKLITPPPTKKNLFCMQRQPILTDKSDAVVANENNSLMHASLKCALVFNC